MYKWVTSNSIYISEIIEPLRKAARPRRHLTTMPRRPVSPETMQPANQFSRDLAAQGNNPTNYCWTRPAAEERRNPGNEEENRNFLFFINILLLSWV